MSTVAGARFVSKQQHQETSRRLLRALLRECTYLPDPASQLYIQKHVVHRFRNASKRGTGLLHQAALSKDEFEKDTARQELQTSLHKGYKGVYSLIRANEGEVKPLLRIMRHTYGRTGLRRYELLHQLLQPDNAPANSDALVDLLHEKQGSKKTKPQKWDITTVPVPAIFQAPERVTGIAMTYSISPAYSKLKALVDSQNRAKILSDRTRLHKQISIPAKNTWGRQMPRNRVSNLAYRKYADLLDAIHAPLPEGEWQRLHGLACGSIPWTGCKTRRKRPAGRPEFLSPSDLEKLVHVGDKLGDALYIDSLIEKPSTPESTEQKVLDAAGYDSRRGYWEANDIWLADEDAIDDAFEEVLQHEMQLKTLNKKLTGVQRGHTITPRFMRRLWSEIFRTCPMMQYDAGAKIWNVTWGTKPKAYAVRASAPRIDELFGFDDAGTAPETNVKPR